MCGSIQEVSPSAKAVLADRGIRPVGTSLETVKGESLIVKEEGDNKSDDSGVQSDLWYISLMNMYSQVLPYKLKRSIEGLRVLCLRWWNRKVIRGMFKWVEDKYGG